MDNLVEDKPETIPMGAPVATLLAGHDSITGELRSSAVRSDSQPDPRGGVSRVTIKVCQGLSEVTEALEVNQSLALEYAGVAKLNEKLKFVKSQKITSESVSIVVYARHETGTKTILNPKLADDIKAKTAAEFVRAYGDAWVSSLAEGGEYYAIYTFYTETSEKQDSLKVEVEGEIKIAGKGGNAAVDVSIANFAKKTNTHWQFDQRLTGMKNPALPNREEIVNFAYEFSKKPLDAAEVVDVTTSFYENVPGFAIAFADVSRNRNYFVGDDPRDSMTGALNEIASLENKVDMLRSIYHCYQYTGDAALDAFGTELANDRRAITAQLQAWRIDPTQKFDRPALSSLTKGTPVLSFTKGATDLWGDSRGGGPFDYGSVEEALYLQRRLVWLRLRGDKHMNRIELKYRDMHGEGQVLRYGGDGGTDSNALSFDSDEYIVSARAEYTQRVDRLTLKTNRGSETQAGSAGQTGDNAAFGPPVRVLGFQGRYGSELDAIQLVYVSFSPAKFQARKGIRRG